MLLSFTSRHPEFWSRGEILADFLGDWGFQYFYCFISKIFQIQYQIHLFWTKNKLNSQKPVNLLLNLKYFEKR